MSETEDIFALRPFRYAPGDYQNQCFDCTKIFMGAKLATRCMECAKKRKDAREFNAANPTNDDVVASKDAEIQKLKEALEPFAKMAAKFIDEDDEAEDDLVEIEAVDGLTLGDLRRARSALGRDR